MTQSPYLPSNGGQDQDPQTGEWSSTGSPAAGQAGFDPAAPYGQFEEPVTDPTVGSTATDDLYAPVGTTGESSTASQTKDAAKNEASDLKDTAVDRGQQVADVAKEQAAAVKDTAVDKGQQVAGVAKDEAAKVTAEASSQAKDLLEQGRTELSSQVGTQQQRLGTLVHSFADELGTMGSSSDTPGALSDLAKQGARTVGNLAHRLENSEPAELLDDLRNFARRRPVVFLTGAALAGVIVGRLTRSVASEAHDKKVEAEAPALTSTTTTGYDAGTYATGGYETGTYSGGSYADAGVVGTGAAGTGYDPETGYAGTTTPVYDETVTGLDPQQGGTVR